jgi:predicted Ser/Thr protein kinase
MVRTQIQLSQQQLNALRRLAAERGVSVAELVREGVDTVLQGVSKISEEKRRRALSVVGKFHSGRSDLSTRHDDYFAEASSK